MAGYLNYFLCYYLMHTIKVLSTRECTFKDGFCDWKNDTTFKFNWTMMSSDNIVGGNMQSRTDDNFIAIYRPKKKQREMKAQLLSPEYSQGHCCFGLWYSIGGGRRNSIKVNALTKKRTFSWKRGEEEMWFHVYVSLNLSTPFQIKIEGNIYTNNTGYVAVDDTTVTTGVLCPADCNFETGFCAWEQDGKYVDEFNWKRIQGNTPTHHTGPKGDHTTGDGYYIFVESDGRSEDDTARLSVLMEGGGKYCLAFWFNMHGDHVKSLNVYITSLGTSEQLVFSEHNSKGMEWKEAQVDIYIHNDHKISLESVIGADNQGDIAVDDIMIRPGVCKLKKSGSLTAVYVTVPLVIIIIVVVSVALLLWRKRHANDTKAESPSDVQSDTEGHKSSSVTNKMYTGQNIENQNTTAPSGAINTTCDDSEYAVITDKRDDSDNVEYNTINTDIETRRDQYYGYDRLKQSMTPFVDKTYSRLLEKDKGIYNGKDDAKERLAESGNETIWTNSVITAKKEAISCGFIENKIRLPFEIEDEPDIEYDHTEAGGLDQAFPKRDDYSHLHNTDLNKCMLTDTLGNKVVNTNQKSKIIETESAGKDVGNSTNETDTLDSSYHNYFILEKK